MEMNIYAYKCKRCGHVQYPYRTVCQNCHENDHNEFDIVPLPKKGKLVTFTHLFNPPGDYEMVFLSLGIVELEDGHRITGQLRIDKPKTGMNVKAKVEVVRQDGYNKSLGMVFYEA
jgi:uncharacterized protein